jgi:PKD repeat protein
MKQYKLVIFSACLLIISCQKKDVVSNPTADFSIANVNSTNLVIGTFLDYAVTNNSIGADSFTWDLGNGTILNSKNIELNYDKPGSYTIVLTAKNQNGKTSLVRKQIQVLSRVLKKIVVKSLNWNASGNTQAGWPVFTSADIWVEIVKGENETTYPILANGSYAAPLEFKTNTITNINSGNVPIIFGVSGTELIDLSTLSGTNGYKGVGYGFNLYAKTTSGTFLLSSSFFSGSNISIADDINSRTFTITSSTPGFSTDFQCTYE